MADEDAFSNEALAQKADLEPEARPEQPEQPEAEQEPEAQAGLEDEDQKFLEERFGGDPLKAAKSYRHLEEKLSEQGQELGQMRKALERMAEADDTYEETYYQVDDDAIEENPAQAAEDAWRAGNQRGVEKAFAEWKELDPTSAALWASNKQIAQVEQRLTQMFQSSVEPLRQHTQQDHLNAAFQTLSRKYEDFNDFFESDSYGEALSHMPEQLKNATLEVLKGGDQTSIASALEYVYGVGKGLSGASAGNSTGNGGQQRQSGAAVMDQERGQPTGGSQRALSDVEERHAEIKGMVTAKDEPGDEPMFVTAARQLRASRHLAY